MGGQPGDEPVLPTMGLFCMLVGGAGAKSVPKAKNPGHFGVVGAFFHNIYLIS